MKCKCKASISKCKHCGKMTLTLREQQYEDILSAISFFCRSYERDAPKTKRAMEALSKKIWKAIHKAREES